MLSLLLTACPGDTGTPRETGVIAGSLAQLAHADLLFPSTMAPSAALLAAKRWENAALASCPVVEEVEGVVIVTGNCTTDAGEALVGSIRADHAPDGGTWVFEGWTEPAGGDAVTWSGSLAWVQTDGANQLTAYDFSARAAEIGLDAAYPATAFHLDDEGRASSAAGQFSIAYGGSSTTLEAGGAWEFGACEEHPVSGDAWWQSGGGRVTADFAGIACGGCVPWSSEVESGTWCAG